MSDKVKLVVVVICLLVAGVVLMLTVFRGGGSGGSLDPASVEAQGMLLVDPDGRSDEGASD